MDGGRRKWEREHRPPTTEVPIVRPTSYRADEQDRSLRAFLPDVMGHIEAGNVHLVDVRSPQEFSGEVLAPPGLPETCQRGGHIPGASHIPWSRAVNEEDGTFRGVDELREVYRGAGIDDDRPVITYCRIGERSSHTWFVLTYLLGHGNTKNYDGSWTEWGNLVGPPLRQARARHSRALPSSHSSLRSFLRIASTRSGRRRSNDVSVHRSDPRQGEPVLAVADGADHEHARHDLPCAHQECRQRGVADDHKTVTTPGTAVSASYWSGMDESRAACRGCVLWRIFRHSPPFQ